MQLDVVSELKEIMSHYDLGELVDFKQNFRGYVNIAYEISMLHEGQRRKYFLRRYREGIMAEELDFEHSVIDHLINQGFDIVARIFRTKQGLTYVKQKVEEGEGEAIFYTTFDFLQGEDKYTWDEPDCNVEELQSSAYVFAQYHNKVFNFVPEGRRHEPKIVDLLPVIAENVERAAEKVGETVFDKYFLESLAHIQNNIKSTLRSINEKEYQHLPQLVIHCDFHPGNLKFEDGKAIGLFDFDWAKVDVRCFDVAFALTYFCTTWGGVRDGEFQLDKAGLFLSSYQDQLKGVEGVGPLSLIELKYLPHLIHASNLYLANWALRDFYGGEEVDPEEYLTYLRHSINLMQWLETKENWKKTVQMVAEAACS